MERRRGQDRRKKCKECTKALALLNKCLSGRVYTDLDDALRNMLQAYMTLKGNYEDLEKAYGKLFANRGGKVDEYKPGPSKFPPSRS